MRINLTLDELLAKDELTGLTLLEDGTLPLDKPYVVAAYDAGFTAPGAVAIEYDPRTKQVKGLGHSLISTERSADRTSVASDDCHRINRIINWLMATQSAWKPLVAVVEIPLSGARSALAIKGMAFATAVTFSTIKVGFGCLVFQVVTPYETKRWCTGNHDAPKEEMIKAVSSTFNVDWPKQVRHKNELDWPKCEAIADAYAAGLTFLRIKPATRTQAKPSVQ